jgi:CheY-like chemotaxis protein
MKTILVVDDEPSICALLKELLSECNLRVVTAQDGFEALHVLNAIHDPVELAVLDFSMPGMDCETLINEIRVMNNNIKLIISSGEPGREFGNPESLGIVAMMPKPYSMQDMKSLVLSQIDLPVTKNFE